MNENEITCPYEFLDYFEGFVPDAFHVAQRILRTERGMESTLYAWYEAAKLVGKNPACKLNPQTPKQW